MDLIAQMANNNFFLCQIIRGLQSSIMYSQYLPGETEWLLAVIGLRSSTMENTGRTTTSSKRHTLSFGLEHQNISTHRGRSMDFRPIPQRMRHIQWIHKFGKKHKYMQVPITYLQVPTCTHYETPPGDSYFSTPELQHTCSTYGTI